MNQPTITPRGRQRLEALERHLREGRLGHRVFDFAVANAFERVSRPGRCGTSGCALGEMPILAPDRWVFNARAWPVLRRLDTGHVSVAGLVASAVTDFRITADATRHLFFPHAQDCASFGGQPLGEDATRYEVADNIRAFLDRAVVDGPE